MYEKKRQDHMTWSYSIIPEIGRHSDLGKYHTYGIQIIGPAGTEILHDISVCKETAECMAERFNRHQLSPYHLRDAVADMLP